MTWTLAAFLAIAALNLAAAVANAHWTWRNLRDLRRIKAVDRLLGQICTEACMGEHQAAVAWRAWRGSMGDIEVSVTGTRWNWTESSTPPNVSENQPGATP